MLTVMMGMFRKLLVGCIVVLLTGCGGGGGEPNSTPSTPAQPQNTAPTIESFNTRSINDNGRVNLTWRVSDSQQTNLNCTISISGGLTLTQTISNCVTTTQLEFTAPSNTNYQAILQVSDGTLTTSQTLSIDVTNLPAAQPDPVTPSTPPTTTNVMKIHFLHTSGQYDVWGLHLWGSAISAETATTWQSPRPLTRVENDYAVYEVPFVDGSEFFNFIVHFGDIKSPAFDLRVIPDNFGTEVWVVQDTAININGVNAEPFADETIARSAFAEVQARSGNAIAVIDMSPVSVSVPTNELADNWQDNANFMEIYVRGYKDSDGDGIGDINGLIEQLDYLDTLGITGLWLMPIMESSDNDHGYETQDYRSIESDYGTLADFDRLISEANRRGIAIVIDYLINHTSFLNPVFLDASSSPNHPLRDWFIWRDTIPTNWSLWGNNPWRTGVGGNFYGAFTSRMPDFNLLNPQVIEFHQNNLAFWLNRGVDGFRFDAVGVLVENGPDGLEDQPQNHPVMRAMRDIITQYPKAYMVCEAPSGFATFALDSSCGKAFHFSAGHAILDSVKQGRSNHTLINVINDTNLANMPLILANHDFFAGNRVANQLNQNPQQTRLAAAGYLLLSANPFTYYGEEIGMLAGANLQADASLRTPMSWTNDAVNAGFSVSNTLFRSLSANATTNNVAAQIADNDSLYYFYQDLYRLRQAYPVLATGVKQVLSTVNEPVLIWESVLNNERVVVALNLSADSVTSSVNQQLTDTSFSLVWSKEVSNESSTLSDNAGELTLTLSAYDVQVWQFAESTD